MRARRIAVLSWVALGLAGPLGAADAWALERTKETTNAPPATTERPNGEVETPGGTPLVHDAASDVKERGYWYLLEDKGYFQPPIADVVVPTNYMRFYTGSPVAYSTNVARSRHIFWDVGFGEEFYVVGRSNRTRRISADGKQWFYGPPAASVRWPTGVSFFIVGDMHMLLDFTGFSAPVIDAEFRLGGGLMGRGIPVVTAPGTTLSHLAWRLKFFHESTHIGDEYLDDIRRRQQAPQGGDPPTAGFIHANISYLALEFLLAIDGEDGARQVDGRTRNLWYWRVYGGYRRLFLGPYDSGVPFPGLDPGATIVRAGEQNEAQFGAELRYRLTPFFAQGARRPDYLVVASDTYVRKQYDYTGLLVAPRWFSAHIVAGVEWGDWADDQMTFRILAGYYNGINPHGQFRNELLDYWGLTLQLDY